MGQFHKIVWGMLHGKDTFCRLCFRSVDDEAIRIQDEVVIEPKSPEGTEELGNVLDLVIGSQVVDNFSPLDRVCDNCVKLALTSYNFVTSVQENFRIFSNAIECITTCLDNLGVVNNYKSLFVSINLNELSCTTYCDYKKCKTKSAVLKQIKNHTNPKPKRKVKDEMNESTLDLYKRQHDKCLPVPLSENDKYSVMRTGDGTKIYYCKSCNKECYRLYNMLRHYQNAHENPTKLNRKRIEPRHNSWVCQNCGKILKNRIALWQHEKIHTNGIQCPKCKKHYKNNHYFTHHLCVSQVGERPKLDKNFVCDQCGASFGRKNTLLLHIKFEHGNGVPHICSWCNKKFYALSQLKTHLVKHTKEKDFKCESCGGRFVTKESLLYHVRTHTGEKPYKCRFCEKHFLSTSRRADHVRIHHMEPSIPCNICNRLFKTHSQVGKHRRLHLNPKSSLYIGNADSLI